MSLRPLACLILLAGCSDNEPAGECARNADCSAGEICLDRDCARLCANDGNCPDGQVCTDGVCAAGTRTQPEIVAVDGDGSANCVATGNACVATSLLVTGRNLSGSAFTVLGAAGGTPLELTASALSDTSATLALPTTIAPGRYTLTARNAAGSADQALELLQGEAGPQGPQGPQGPPGALDQGQVDAMNVAIAAVQPALVTLTDAATIAVNAGLGDIFTVTLAGDRALANPTGLTAGAHYTLLVRQDAIGGRLLTFGSAYKFPAETHDSGVFVPAATGVAIGNLINGAGLAAVFDGNLNQNDATGGFYSGSGNGYVGKGWSTRKRIKRVRAFGFTDTGFQNPANGPIRLSVQGSNDNAIWTDLFISGALNDRASLTFDISVGGGLDATNAFTYHRLRIESLGSDGNDRVAELEFYEDPGLLPNRTCAFHFASDATNLYLVGRSTGM